MTHRPEHIAGATMHRRKGEIRHMFRYGVDYVLIDPEASAPGPLLFSRNRFNLFSVHDADHGGPLTDERGPVWARQVLADHGLGDRPVQLRLLTQPRFLGYVFNPVSFWLVLEGDTLIAVIAEVSTPFGDRHSYLCHTPGFGPIERETRIHAPKSLHVSPFQEVKGSYAFTFDIQDTVIDIRILHSNGDEGVLATLTGPRAPLTNAGILGASLRRPLGAIRTIALIYWQALRLKLKGATYRTRPTPPKTEVT
ncbi:DUF1365 domain-containing protein [Gymnodinialimonas ceratoperidinii]|uniref:DUF1365 domain-containing protein n=1 Tax=Gymnodinialimonas ceratoperidinii TaxID=2856823 RepID=A0A8F6TY58_9RHOB|nr:DUF1365 domain-containing protein [Gymnodinialimonas ceratoperidinii]QXT40098.1 DUF1365 domain-containing protein [Gymnodinialimonas ceratoperidinii]